jgi:hypothetical protein
MLKLFRQRGICCFLFYKGIIIIKIGRFITLDKGIIIIKKIDKEKEKRKREVTSKSVLYGTLSLIFSKR